jgi:hypothetical protein
MEDIGIAYKYRIIKPDIDDNEEKTPDAFLMQLDNRPPTQSARTF